MQLGFCVTEPWRLCTVTHTTLTQRSQCVWKQRMLFSVCVLPGGEYRSVLLLSRSINMQDWEVLRHFLHVLVVEQAVETRLIYTHTHTHTHTHNQCCNSLLIFFFCLYIHCMVTVNMCVHICLLTIESDVMVGEDCGSVALSNSPHGNVQHTMGCLHIVLLSNTSNNKLTSACPRLQQTLQQEMNPFSIFHSVPVSNPASTLTQLQ